MTLDTKICAMAAVVKERDNDYIGAADSGGKLKNYHQFAREFNEAAMDYFNSEDGIEYLKEQDISIDDIDGLGSVEMNKGIVAAVIKYAGKKYMVSNGEFSSQVKDVAGLLGVSYDLAERFVLDHEATHLKYDGEVETAEKQKEFYGKKVEEAKKEGNEVKQHEYETLAAMADNYIQQQTKAA